MNLCPGPTSVTSPCLCPATRGRSSQLKGHSPGLDLGSRARSWKSQRCSKPRTALQGASDSASRRVVSLLWDKHRPLSCRGALVQGCRGVSVQHLQQGCAETFAAAILGGVASKLSLEALASPFFPLYRSYFPTSSRKSPHVSWPFYSPVPSLSTFCLLGRLRSSKKL